MAAPSQMDIWKIAMPFLDTIHDFDVNTSENLDEDLYARMHGFNITEDDTENMRIVRKDNLEVQQRALSLYLCNDIIIPKLRPLLATYRPNIPLQLYNIVFKNNVQNDGFVFDNFRHQITIDEIININNINNFPNIIPVKEHCKFIISKTLIDVDKKLIMNNPFKLKLYDFMKLLYKTNQITYVVDSSKFVDKIWCIPGHQSVYRGLHYYNDPAPSSSNAIHPCVKDEFQTYNLQKQANELIQLQEYGCFYRGNAYRLYHKSGIATFQLDYNKIQENKPRGIPLFMQILYTIYQHINLRVNVRKQVKYESLKQFIEQNLTLSIRELYKIGCNITDCETTTDEYLCLDREQYIWALMDIKRSGDYLQAKSVQVANQSVDKSQQKYVFVSEDRLAIMYAISRDIPCIWMKYKQMDKYELHCYNILTRQEILDNVQTNLDNMSLTGGMHKTKHYTNAMKRQTMTIKAKQNTAVLDQIVSYDDIRVALGNKNMVHPFILKFLDLLESINYQITVFWYIVLRFVFFHIHVNDEVPSMSAGNIRPEFKPRLRMNEKTVPFKPILRTYVKEVPLARIHVLMK